MNARRGESSFAAARSKIVFRQVEPHRAAVLFRRGLLDEAPVPLGDIRAALADETVQGSVHVNQLAAVDALDASRLPASMRTALSATADRRDYALLVPEDLDAAAKSPPARAFRKARRAIPDLPHVPVRVRVEGDGTLRYGAALLAASWRDLGLDVASPDRKANAVFARRSPPRGIAVARAVDARFVSPRVRDWREDARGLVDYSRVNVR